LVLRTEHVAKNEVTRLFNRTPLSIATILASVVLFAAGFNFFLVPQHLLTGGVSGIAMMIGYFTDWNIGLLLFLLNLPLMVWGWFVIGRRFIALSVLFVAASSGLLQVFPVVPVIDDPLLGSVFGGVLVGIATGIALRAGGSSGGFDILGSIVTKYRDFPLGSTLFTLNGFVILSMGYLEGWEAALYSMISIYVTGRIVDAIHVRHVKLTLFIVTKRKEDLLAKLMARPRGVTVLKSQGAFSNAENDMLMTVVTRYELAEVRKIIHDTDPDCFVNIVETAGVIGQFRRDV
jgi:uncharacterized membrane-anchored protein YitT (DUF2179 family)